MSSGREVRLGVVGIGHRGAYLSKLANSVPGCKVVAMCERIQALLRRGAQDLGVPDSACYADFEAFLEGSEMDAVFFCVAPHEQPDLICAALEAGKHVLCEVPLCFTLEDCWRIVTAVERSGLKFQMAEQLRYSAWAAEWKRMVDEGAFGKVLYVEGQYFHQKPPHRYFHDAETGENITREQAAGRDAIKSRFWSMPHDILYLPHELSPILHILGDRIEKVSGMSTGSPSYVLEWFPNADLQIALMHTVNDVVLRLGVTFTAQVGPMHAHCNRLVGTKGWVEQPRCVGEKGRMWLDGRKWKHAVEVDWAYTEQDAPAEALRSGHGGNDYYAISTFVESVLEDKPTHMDVYAAADTAAPAILASLSCKKDNVCYRVPDFRPGEGRVVGEMPGEAEAKGIEK